MRRTLRKIAEKHFGKLRDTSTLADAAWFDGLVERRRSRRRWRRHAPYPTVFVCIMKGTYPVLQVDCSIGCHRLLRVLLQVVSFLIPASQVIK
ncbi:MAG TPA: hypothetical protein VEA61_07440 [Allosphingosinicella sp.]|nr:hypothetical protein [Allosphingosinicella sp.]